jgi:ABC-2 type transport system ATP-binding protein
MGESAIVVKNLNKIFEIPHEKRNTLKSFFVNPFRKISKERFSALQNINFEVKKGEFIGVIGRNGCGKSTLLKILAGIYDPTAGEVEISGTLISFLELGVGFNPELTGRENVFLNGTILGMSKKYLWAKYDEIVEFSEIGKFMDLQVKNYSSGMIVRLAFSIAIQAKADIYLMDEVLAVGDGAFQKKSLEKMENLLTSGATVVFVSHTMASIEKYCSKVLYLKNGQIEFFGDVNEGIKQYNRELSAANI